LRKYYACFTGLFVSTHVKRLFYAKQISRRTCSKHRNPAAKSEPAKPKATRPAPVRIIPMQQNWWVNRSELGEVTGESCQAQSGLSAEYPDRAQAHAD
jgi:RcsF protein